MIRVQLGRTNLVRSFAKSPDFIRTFVRVTVPRVAGSDARFVSDLEVLGPEEFMRGLVERSVSGMYLTPKRPAESEEERFTWWYKNPSEDEVGAFYELRKDQADG